MGIRGIGGEPIVDLEPHLAEVGALDGLDAVHDEICLALAELPVDYTGGSHRSMGIMPAGLEPTALGDYGEAIGRMTDDEYATFARLADDPRALPPGRADAATFGEERAHPLSRRQMLWLKVRFGVYFPWKAYLELIPNRAWSDKADPTGKDFTARAKAYLPKTIAFVKRLPFAHVGRCNVMGLEANDHGTVHRDADPAEQFAPDHFVLLCPKGDKRFFVLDPDTGDKVYPRSRAYWFDDANYHGVDADPFFRYSLRVDGVFDPAFLARVAPRLAPPPRP